MLLLASVLCCCYSSYSLGETIFGTTTNAADNGLNWVMTNVLPQQAGLNVNGVIYSYTVEKNTEDPFTVTVQNEDALNGGYIFRSTDDWSGLPGSRINRRFYPLQSSQLERWGDGSIETTGFGTVSDPYVAYNYNYDPCFDPQVDPSCPGYKPPVPVIPEINIADPLNDQFIQDELDRKAVMEDEDQKEKDRKKKKDDKKKDERLETVLGIVNTTLLAADAQAKAAEMLAMNYVPNYYYDALEGGKYEDTTTLVENVKLLDNKKARRVSFAQQLLHIEMVNSQYNKKTGEK